MSNSNVFVDIMIEEIIKSNQKDWFLSFKKKYDGGFINNIDNPKLQALKNLLNKNLSDPVFALYCYVVEYKLVNLPIQYATSIDSIV